MPTIQIGVVDVLPIDPGGARDEWRILVLRRARETRCPGSWEVVHGRIEPAEGAEHAALRELREETGLSPTRLYNVMCQSFYLHRPDTVQVAVVFAAFVSADTPVALSSEHDAHEWLSLASAKDRLSWPRSRQALQTAFDLVADGNAGSLEDVLRVL